jgi:hypothetical protein
MPNLENQVIYTIDRKDQREFEIDVLAGTGLKIVRECMRKNPDFNVSTEQWFSYPKPFEDMCGMVRVMLRYPRFTSSSDGPEQIDGDFYCYQSSYPMKDKEEIIRLLKDYIALISRHTKV